MFIADNIANPPSARRAVFIDQNVEPIRPPPGGQCLAANIADPPSARRAVFIDHNVEPIRPPPGGQCL